MVEHALDEAFAVEASGWKEGTAIAQSQEKLEWYRHISRWAAEKTYTQNFFVAAEWKVIAFDLALESSPTIFAMKTGYDEHIATRLSAGNPMRC